MMRFVGWLIVFWFGLIASLEGCTVFSSHAFVAKTLDWSSGKGILYINKRHVYKRAGLNGGGQAASWVSRYASVTMTETGRDYPWEGMNEAGLSVDVLQLLGSLAPPESDPRPAIDFVQWIQYILDTSSTLNEAIANAEKVRIAPGITTHYFICDASGACGTFEYLSGKLVIHEGSELPFAALANDPYGDSVKYFESQRESPDDILSTPSNNSLDRFSRAVVWAERFPQAKAAQLPYAFSALENLSELEPFYRTVWQFVFDLKSRTLSIRTLDAPVTKTISLSDFDPSCRSGVSFLDVNSTISGNVDGGFRPYSSVANRALVESSAYLTPNEREGVESYPDSLTRCE